MYGAPGSGEKSRSWIPTAPEYAPNGFQIAIPIQIIRLQVACFSPLVPTVDGDQWWLVRVIINILLCHTQPFFDVFRGAISHDITMTRDEARIVVPSDAYMGEIRERKGSI